MPERYCSKLYTSWLLYVQNVSLQDCPNRVFLVLLQILFHKRIELCYGLLYSAIFVNGWPGLHLGLTKQRHNSQIEAV